MMERRTIEIRGIVQGVGFRPFVHRLAARLGLGGFVRNHGGVVLIEAEGDSLKLDAFLVELKQQAPALARIDSLSWRDIATVGGSVFRIESSDGDTAGGDVFVSPDIATCDACLAELFDPRDRRYRYPFLNCTNCGPRLTIITGSPYDRPNTTMAAFAMCPACRREYDDPADRRFHAQPTACTACGPRLELLDARGQRIDIGEPLARFIEVLRHGGIGAMKGLGGFHLICDARNETAVAELRRRKHRDEKPFAVMVRDAACAEALCEVDAAERALLSSMRRPIVLLRKRGRMTLADAVAPGNPYLGVMLPYTPLHHLLMNDITGDPVLVMTSGNRADEPIAYRNEEAVERLAGIADIFLMHDRPIRVRCDDSVSRIVGSSEQPVRRSRGYAPEPIRLPMTCTQPMLAVGGQLKGTFALGRGQQAFLSHHLGDLDHYQAFAAFEQDIPLFERLFEMAPAILAHDLHPDYASTRYAQRRAAQTGIALVGVQHHHAHMCACMAEHGLDEPVIGVTFDGTGYGLDGAIWGGEFLIGDYRQFRRAAHLRYVGMPGGDAAIREPWRMAAAHLLDAGCGLASLDPRIGSRELRTIERMLERRLNAPPTSSIGRLFDAVASLAGVRDRASYEGQAAIELEWLATNAEVDGAYPLKLLPGPGANDPMIVETRDVIRAVAQDAACGVAPSVIARRFHAALVEMIAAVCTKVRDDTGIRTIVLTGGVFLNALLTREASARLTRAGFLPCRHHRVPPNDGGLSLGQLAAAADAASTR